MSTQEVNLELSKKISAWAIPGCRLIINPESIIEHIQITTGVNIHERTRMRDVAESRQIAMYVIRFKTGLSLSKIGMLFGYDHTTVLHSIKAVENLMGDRHYMEKYSSIFKFYELIK